MEQGELAELSVENDILSTQIYWQLAGETEEEWGGGIGDGFGVQINAE